MIIERRIHSCLQISHIAAIGCNGQANAAQHNVPLGHHKISIESQRLVVGSWCCVLFLAATATVVVVMRRTGLFAAIGSRRAAAAHAMRVPGLVLATWPAGRARPTAGSGRFALASLRIRIYTKYMCSIIMDKDRLPWSRCRNGFTSSRMAFRLDFALESKYLSLKDNDCWRVFSCARSCWAKGC